MTHLLPISAYCLTLWLPTWCFNRYTIAEKKMFWIFFDGRIIKFRLTNQLDQVSFTAFASAPLVTSLLCFSWINSHRATGSLTRGHRVTVTSAYLKAFNETQRLCSPLRFPLSALYVRLKCQARVVSLLWETLSRLCSSLQVASV